jgi:hypothetical protein
MIASANLGEIVLQLFRDSGGKKVMLCNSEGEVLAHAGAVGAIDEATGDALAQLIAEVVHGATEGRLPATKDLVATVPGGLPGGLSVCATAIEGRAALVVVFDSGSTTLERVRLKIRRARELLGKSLPRDASASDPKPEPS